MQHLLDQNKNKNSTIVKYYNYFHKCILVLSKMNFRYHYSSLESQYIYAWENSCATYIFCRPWFFMDCLFAQIQFL